MPLSIQRMRWVLIAGALLLIGVLAAFIGYGRYLALKRYKQIIARSGISLTHDSNGVTYSQSIKGKKIFTIRAKSESTLGGGKYALHDAELFLYNRYGEAADHIYGSEMEYDQNEQVARAKGEVYMDIQPPQGLANGGRTQTATTQPRSGTAPVVHVRTSGLVYVRKLGIAATKEQIAFSYGGMSCTAVGAEFDTNGNTLRLLANVQMDGLAHGKPLHVIASRAEVNREDNVANVIAPIVTSGDRSMSADAAVIDLRQDGSVKRVQGTNHVVMTSGTQRVTSEKLDATLSEQSLPQTAKLTGHVVLVDSNPMKTTNGSAGVVDVTMDAQGQPTKVVATGAAKLQVLDRRAQANGLNRSIEGGRIIALFAPGRRKSTARLTEIHAIERAHASGQTLAAQSKGSAANAQRVLKNVQVSADDLRTTFAQTADQKMSPERLYGTGHTRLQQDGPLGAQQVSSGDSLQMVFARNDSAAKSTEGEAIEIVSAVQAGNIVLHTRAVPKAGATGPGAVTDGTSDRASYDGETQVLTLTGHTHLDGESGSVVAPVVSINQRTQDSDATGGVQATFERVTGAKSPSANPGSVSFTHVLAASAHFDHATRSSTFRGTDAAPARMWQGASQVEAATLFLDGNKRIFSARPGQLGGLVHAILESGSSPHKPGAASKTPSMIHVASPLMDYDDLQREATFAGGVVLNGTMGEVRGEHAVAFLTDPHSPTGKPATLSSEEQPSPLNGSIDRVVVYGAVQIDQPGRHGTGEQLLYTAATANYVLTGTPTSPPRVTDAQQGNVTGATLLFGDAGSTIVVAGEQGAPKGKGGRVHTETYVHPGDKKEERP